jgi:hypothetical protein
MGQTIQIWDTTVVGDVLIVSTDRSLTGQDGETYVPGDAIGADAIFPAQLAGRLFEADPSIDHVYVMSNVLSIRRREGWDDSSVASARDLVASFFLFYETQSAADAPQPVEEGAPVAAGGPEDAAPSSSEG